jgi:hypothetical protein
MAASSLAPTDFKIVNPEPASRSYISWPAVFAGNAVTGGLILVMLPLGAAAGLAMASFYSGRSASATTIGWSAIIWLAFMYLFSTWAGGYVVGRLRARAGEANIEEVRFRDSVNGVVFWGVGMIVSALFTFFTVTSAVGTATSAAGNALGGAASAAANAAPSVNTDYMADVFLRTTGNKTQANNNNNNNPPPRSDVEARAEISRILAASAATGQMQDADRQYLAAIVAQRTGLSDADAKARVDQALKRADEYKNQMMDRAQAAAETARKAAASFAFWTAILSLISAILAAYAARMGGQHRDENRF